ncbi:MULTISPECIES: tyrosine-type recombinase/integrase [unclassified Crossiella]|uniref:tyrosine-type recombinase/integrase n=1 Tax=unclassified Crossiella TaxID=2620835 RepID=UPI002000101F|nr:MULTISPECIES: tyrosine-type recombinase/integrase [unclassified Crossiella]MCK2243666.1 site-specific integrase [Crossiella sp. S99.2]MCK2257525.1 site-specific integrase [Crossiella sp. S99.1]
MAWVEKRGDGFRVRYRLDDGTIFTESGFVTQVEADNRAADIESDQRRHRFPDPRLAQTTIDEWIRKWTEAHHVAEVTWTTYDSHIRNHIMPRWTGTALGDIQRIEVKGWVNKKLRPVLADKSAKDILVLFSAILGEAVDEQLIGSNPCRKLRINFNDRPERPHATTDEVDALAGRMEPDAGLMTITDAYTGLRWGELAGLQWIRTYLDEDPRIEVDPNFGALHEVNGKLELGPPKTPASARTVHLPPFLTTQLAEHRERNPDSRFVFTGAHGGLHRRSNFRRRVWLPSLAGDKDKDWQPLNEEMHFHDLRHTHATWLIEDTVPRILRLIRLGHKRKDVDDDYSHVTDLMIEQMLAKLQRRWEQDGGWMWRRSPGLGCDAA